MSLGQPSSADWTSQFSRQEIISLQTTTMTSRTEKAKATAKATAEEKAEPKIKWRKSKARSLLYKDLQSGTIPLQPKGEGSMKLEDIYNMRPEFQEYGRSKFSRRLSSLRDTVTAFNDRASNDQQAFNNYKDNHPTSHFSQKGYIQWQGSEAQELLWQDMADGLHESQTKQELYSSRPEYFESFPLDVFRDKIAQEDRTRKYLHTLKKRGKGYTAS